MDHEIAGKKILVTGSAGGCGAAIAKALDELDAILILHAIPQKEEALKEECKKYKNATYVTADLSDAASIEAMWEQVSGIDILINNAGIWPTAYVREMTVESFRKTLDINLIAPFILCRTMPLNCAPTCPAIPPRLCTNPSTPERSACFINTSAVSGSASSSSSGKSNAPASTVKIKIVSSRKITRFIA